MNQKDRYPTIKERLAALEVLSTATDKKIDSLHEKFDDFTGAADGRFITRREAGVAIAILTTIGTVIGTILGLLLAGAQFIINFLRGN